MTVSSSEKPAYSDTTQAILDHAIERLATVFSENVLNSLKALIAEHDLSDPDKVLVALGNDKESQDDDHQGNQDQGN